MGRLVTVGNHAFKVFAGNIDDKDFAFELFRKTRDSGSRVISPLSVTYALDAVGILTGLPQNYVSKESLQAMLTAMQSAGLFASYTMTYNATTGKYEFTFTANS